MNIDEKRIIGIIGDVFPKLNELDRAILLGIAEGMALKADQMKEEKSSAN